jgi:hypothetical protein
MPDEEPIPFEPVIDTRPRMPEPLPVRVIAVADVSLPAGDGLERKLDEFYVDLLGFEHAAGYGGLVYRAENVRLHFQSQCGVIEHPSLRTLQIEIRSLMVMEQKLIDSQVEFTHARGLNPGMESLVLMDPAGNWIELIEKIAVG